MARPMAEELILKQGGEPVEAPALREIPIGDNPAAIAFADRLVAGEFDLVIFLTGVGTRYLARRSRPRRYPKRRVGRRPEAGQGRHPGAEAGDPFARAGSPDRPP